MSPFAKPNYSLVHTGLYSESCICNLNYLNLFKLDPAHVLRLKIQLFFLYFLFFPAYCVCTSACNNLIGSWSVACFAYQMLCPHSCLHEINNRDSGDPLCPLSHATMRSNVPIDKHWLLTRYLKNRGKSWKNMTLHAIVSIH